MPWTAIGVNRMQEFMIRYEELGIDALKDLYPVPSKVTLYLEYYKKHIGWASRNVEHFLLFTFKPWFEQYDPKYEYWPHDLMVYMRDNYFDAHPKTSGMRVFREVLVPGLLIVCFFLFIFCKLCACCCSRKKVSDEHKEKKD